MSTKTILSASILAVAAMTSVSAFANDSNSLEFSQPAQGSSLTRAQVQADLQQAKRAGYVAMPTNHGYPTAAVAQSSNVTRADVRASAAVDRTLYN